MLAQETGDNVVRLADWAWRRPHRPTTRFQRALAVLEPAQKRAVLGLMDVFGAFGDNVWEHLPQSWRRARAHDPTLPGVGTSLAEFSDDALISLTLEAGYTLGDADTFKAVLPYFLAGAFARPLDSWVVDPDLLKAKLETLAFDSWPSAQRRRVAHALAVYAQHELDLAERAPGEDDEALVAAKTWAEHALAAAL